MEINFIPIDYDYFDWQGQNYTKVVGRTDKGKKVCIIDKCDIYFWAILKPKISEKKIKQIQEKIEKIQVKSASRTSKVEKTELHTKNFLGEKVKAIHKWTKNGTYLIKAKAKDINGTYSEWSDPVEISVPRKRNVINTLNLRIFKIFPFINHLLKYAKVLGKPF